MSLTKKPFILAAMAITLTASFLVACGDNPEIVMPLEPAAEQPSPDASTPQLEDETADASSSSE